MTILVVLKPGCLEWWMCCDMYVRCCLQDELPCSVVFGVGTFFSSLLNLNSSMLNQPNPIPLLPTIVSSQLEWQQVTWHTRPPFETQTIHFRYVKDLKILFSVWRNNHTPDQDSSILRSCKSINNQIEACQEHQKDQVEREPKTFD